MIDKLLTILLTILLTGAIVSVAFVAIITAEIVVARQRTIREAVECNLMENVINIYRRHHGKSQLQCNRGLRESANERAYQIATGQIPFAHDGYQQHIEYYYGDYDTAGENLAWKFDGFKEVMQGWHDSPAHKQNMQSELYCQMGVGYADEMYKVWVLHLGCK